MFLFLILLASPAIARTPRPRNPYPNELPGFKFYRRHLAPLRPFISDRASIIRVFGSDQGITFDGWRAWALYVGEGGTVSGHAWAQNIVGLLASVDVKPKDRVSMVGVKFPTVFQHSVGGVSEINVSRDIYEDSFGLQYWLFS